MKGIKGFQKGHPIYKGSEKGWFKKGQKFGKRKHIRKGHPSYKSKERSRKISESKLGNKNPMKRRDVAFKATRHRVGSRPWNYGTSVCNPYPPEFNARLRLKIRTRDNFICCLCGKTEVEELEELNRVLAVNHIDFNKNNNEEINLNTLCLRCNVKINGNRDYWKNYFQKLCSKKKKI